MIRVPDDTGGYPGLAEDAAAAHRRDAIGELDLADRPHFLWTPVTIHRARFHVHGRDNIVAAAGIRQKIFQQTNTTIAANLAIAVSSAEAVAGVPPRAIDKRQTPVANH